MFVCLSLCLTHSHLAHTYFFHTNRHKKTHTNADNHIYEDSDVTYKAVCMFIQQSQMVLLGLSHIYTQYTLLYKCDLHPITLAVEAVHSFTHRDANPQMVCDPPHIEGWQ